MRNDLECDFINFKPDQSLKNFVWNIAEKVHDLAPINSTLRLILRKKDDAVLATCRIFSHAGVFEAEAHSERELAAVRKVEEKIRHQLDKWKDGRFSQSKEGAGSAELAL